MSIPSVSQTQKIYPQAATSHKRPAPPQASQNPASRQRQAQAGADPSGSNSAIIKLSKEMITPPILTPLNDRSGTPLSGAFGAIYLAPDKPNRIVKVERYGFQNKELSEAVKKGCFYKTELLYRLSKIKSPYIIKFFSATDNPRTKEFSTTLERGGEDLFSVFMGHEKAEIATASQIRPIAKQVFEGLAFLHRKKIVHADIKPENILLDEKGNAKIIDFGSAEDLEKPRTFLLKRGTNRYRSPEHLIQGMINEAEDVWAFGCTMFALLTHNNFNPIGYQPKHGSSSSLHLIMDRIGKDTLKFGKGQFSRANIGKRRVAYVSSMDKIFSSVQRKSDFEQLRTLLVKTLTFDPANRITAKKALNHPFLKDASSSSSTQKVEEKKSRQIILGGISTASFASIAKESKKSKEN